jgi:peptidoglycan/LPS O-acetylase OafA/YrhL
MQHAVVGNVDHAQSSLPGASPVRAVAPRLDYIDGLRAVAALWVAVHHIIITVVPTKTLSVPIVGPIVGSLFFGQFPVMIFLLLSGFCLYYPYVRKSPDAPPAFTMGYLPYLRRRARRIAPPYYWAGAFCLLLDAIPAVMVGAWRVVGPVDASVVLSHVFFVHNLIPSHSGKIDYPMWSIGLEWQLYLLFPILVGLFRRWDGRLVAAGALLLSVVIRLIYRRLPEGIGAALHDGPFSYLEIFCLGMVVAQLTARRRPVAANWKLGLGFCTGLAIIRLGSGNGLVHDLAASASALCVLLMAADATSAAYRILSRPLLVRVGEFSYSLYLVHAPLLHLCWLSLRPLQLGPDLEFAMLAIVGTPLIVLACYGFHLVFERRYMGAPEARGALKPADVRLAPEAVAQAPIAVTERQ